MEAIHSLKLSSRRGCDVITVVGALQHHETEHLEAALDEILSAERNRVIVDLGKVSHICSAALGVLVGFKKQFETAGGDLKMVSQSEATLQLLKITSLDNFFDILASVNDAVADFD